MLSLCVRPFWLSPSLSLRLALLHMLVFEGVHLDGVRCHFGVVSGTGVPLSEVVEALTLLSAEDILDLVGERCRRRTLVYW